MTERSLIATSFLALPGSAPVEWRIEPGLTPYDQALAFMEERADAIDPVPYQGPSGPEPRTLMCPQCRFVPLIRMVDVELPDLHFESCKECYGRYYDAGEFREVSEDPSLLERLFGRD